MSTKTVLLYGAMLLALVIGIVFTMAGGGPSTGTPMQNDRLDSFAATTCDISSPAEPMVKSAPIYHVNVPDDPALSARLPLGTYDKLVAQMHEKGVVVESMDIICWWYKYVATDNSVYDFQALTSNRPNDPGKQWACPPYVRVFVDGDKHISPFSYRLIPGDTVILESPGDTVELASIRRSLFATLNEKSRKAP